MTNSEEFQRIKMLGQAHEACLQMLITHNVIDVFRYSAEEDTLYVMRNRGTGPIEQHVKENYLKCNTVWSLADDSHDKLVNLFKSLVEGGTSTPDQGTMELIMNDGIVRLVCHYQAIRDSQHRLYHIIGQMEDLNLAYSRMLKTIEQQNDYISLVKAMTLTYASVINVNLQDLTYTLLHGSPEVLQIANQFSHVKDLARLVGENVLNPEDMNRYTDFINPYTLSNRLMDQQFIAAEFNTRSRGWIKIRIIPSKYDNEGRVTNIIVTTEDIDAEHREQVYLKELSEQDALTKLYNRHAGERLINELLKTEKIYLFAIFDCDHFKVINDTFGHMVGDKVIMAIGKVLTDNFPNQIAMRLGGDEFVLFLYGESIRRSIASITGGTDLLKFFKDKIQQIEIPEVIDFQCSVSGGAVISDGSTMQSFDTLYRTADKALYSSKQIRNGYITYAKTSSYR